MIILGGDGILRARFRPPHKRGPGRVYAMKTLCGSEEPVAVSWAAPSDLLEVASIIDQGFTDKFAPAYGADSAVRLQCIRTIVENRGIDWKRMIVARAGGRVVGFSVITWNGAKACTNEWECIRSLASVIGWGKAVWGSLKMMLLEYSGPKGKECDVYMFGVLESCRKKGIGRLLIAASELEAARNGCDSLTLHVTINNEGAIRFYRAVGFEVSSTWRAPHIKALFGIPGYHSMRKAVNAQGVGKEQRAPAVVRENPEQAAI